MNWLSVDPVSRVTADIQIGVSDSGPHFYAKS